jgi:zinc transporter ZupT
LCLVLGFSAGAVVAVAFFDLIPEALALSGPTRSPATTLSLVALGFLTYLVLDRLQMLRAAADDRPAGSGDAVQERGALGAASLSVHSFLDGIAIGVALQVSAAVGLVVAIAVLAHDFSDGINTTSIVMKNGGSPRQAMRWLMIDALTPAAGIAATYFFSVPPATIGILLALFAGFFLYVGASDLIPESHHAHPKLLTTIMTLLGAGFLYVAVALASA